MIHELLLALRGHIGGLFVMQEDKIRVLPISYLNPGEESLLNRICESGTNYSFIQSFIDKYKFFNVDPDSHPGLYMNSLICSLEEVLLPYDNKIEELERECMLNSEITLTYIQTSITEYKYLLESLCNLIRDIQKRKIRGCQLLNVLHKHTLAGSPQVKSAVLQLQAAVHKVMYGQLTSWLLHGRLEDPYYEFFIHKVERQATVETEANRQANENGASKPTNQDEELGIGGLSGEQVRQLHKSMMVDSDLPESQDSSSCEFRLNGEMLPLYITDSVLNKILFIGEFVDMFENDRAYQHTQSILADRRANFCTELYNLSQNNKFDVLLFESMIDEIRQVVSERLWDVSVNDSKLVQVLHRVKNIFLLGRCDLFITFIDESDQILSCPPSALTNIEVLRRFRRSLTVLLFDEDLYQPFTLYVDKTEGVKTRQNGWTLLSAKFDASWPLHLFFTSQCVDRYNIIFRFLLSVKRVYHQLNHSWLSSHITQLVGGDKSEINISEQRNHMMYIINILQYYLQVDVVESQYSELLTRISNSRDFEVIRSCHETFIANLLSQCFLLNVPVNHCINRIIETCTSFCVTVQSIQNEGEIETEQLDHLINIQNIFEKQTLLLFNILNTSKSHQNNPFLLQLVMKINYNQYFSKNRNTLIAV